MTSGAAVARQEIQPLERLLIEHEGRVVAVYGRPGMGKTTLIRRLMRTHSRVIIFDPKAEYERGQATASLGAMYKALRRLWRRQSWQVILQPTGGFVAAAGMLGMFALRLARARPGKILLVIDEAAEALPTYEAPAAQGLKMAIMQGRAAGLSVIAATQRPASVSTTLRGNASAVACFNLPRIEDAKAALAGMCPDEWARRVTGLPAGDFLEIMAGAPSSVPVISRVALRTAKLPGTG